MPEIRYADSDADVLACFELMRQLRPHLTGEAEFLQRWRKQRADDYHLLVAWEESTPVALAGFRYQENLLYGTHVYVDDLVTTSSCRSKGYGHLLMDRLKSETKARGIKILVLDTPLNNVLGHRFYYRNGLLARALRFGIVLDETNSTS